MSAGVAEKSLPSNILRRFERICLGIACAEESEFVNHGAVSVPNQFLLGFSQGRILGGRRGGVPILSPCGEEGAWHARIAD
jgi:hypothetical protein